MAEDQGERTEEATQQRREDFRKKGQVAFSKELSSTLMMAFSAVAIFILSKFYLENIVESFKFNLGLDMVAAVRGGDVFTALRMTGEKIAFLLLPVFGIALLIGIGSQVLQTGFLQVEDALNPKIEKLNPIDGLKRLFSLKNLVEGIKSLLKLILVFGIVYLVMKSEVFKIPQLLEFSVQQLFHYLGQVSVKLLSSIAIAMTVLTIADYFFQRWDLEKKMMMTKQEVKEENKSREGDPLIKARIRRVQREMSNRRMMQKVPTADVIITNPTHIAVALKYDENLPAPQLIAKGADLIAEKIKALAKENNIPIVENKPLARTIFKTMKLGQVIPRELFVAVAEVLSYVYKLKKRVRR
jgi:flagellar biosynthetic protein FlhB